MAENLPSYTFPIPTELRMEIFRYSFAVGRIVPYPDSYDEIDEIVGSIPDVRSGDEQHHELRPFVAMLQVSRKMMAEAQVILYGSNLFVLQSDEAVDMFLDTICMGGNDRRDLVKMIEIRLTRSGICEDQFVSVTAQTKLATFEATEGNFDSDDVDSTEADEKRGRAFERALHRIIKIQHHEVNWRRIIDPVLANFSNLRRLEIDLRQCWCGSGCCDLQSLCLNSFRDSFVHGIPQEIKFDGLRGFSSTPDVFTLGDSLVRSIFEHWTYGMESSETAQRLGLEAESFLHQEMEAELNDNGRF